MSIFDIGKILTQLSSIYGIVNGISNSIGSVWNAINNVDDIIIGRVNQTISGVQTAVSNVSNTVQNTVNHAQTAIQNTVYGVENKITTGINNVTTAVTNTVNSITSTIGNAFTSGMNTLRVVLDSVVNSAKQEITNVINFAVGIATTLERQLQNAITAAVNSAVNLGRDIANGVQNGISQLGKNIENTVSGVVNRVIASAESAYNYLSKQVQHGIDIVGDNITRAVNYAKQQGDNAYNAIKAFIDSQRREIEEQYNDLKVFVRTEVINEIKHQYNIAKDGVNDEYQSVKTYWSNIPQAAMAGLTTTLDEYSTLLPALRGILDRVATNQYDSSDQFWDDMLALGEPIPVIKRLLEFIIILPSLIGIAGALSGPFVTNVRTLAITSARPENITIADAIRAQFKGVIDYDTLKMYGAKNGLPDDQIDIIYQSSRPILDPLQLRDLFLRSEISEQEHDSQLAAYGLTEEQIKQTKVLYFFVPPPQDLITMAVREVFSPEIAEKFGQFEDYPLEFERLAAQLGISSQWAKNYWAMHWGLPSPQMGYEMLHRGIIDPNELKLLLKSLDIMPFWREKLLDLSYNVFTRVDTRRMFEMGVLDEIGVFNEYKAQGYNEERAKKLTEFTIRLAQQGDNPDDVKIKDLTRGVIETAYSIGEIDRQDAVRRFSLIGIVANDANLLLDIVDYKNTVEDNEKLQDKLLDKVRDMAVAAYKRGAIGKSELSEMLSNVGVNEAIIQLYITTTDYDNELELREVIIEGLFAKYRSGHITEGDFRDTLSLSGFTTDEIQQAIVKADKAFDYRFRQPSQERLERWVKKEIITPQDYYKELAALGFDDTHIINYLLDAGIKPEEL